MKDWLRYKRDQFEVRIKSCEYVPHTRENSTKAIKNLLVYLSFYLFGRSLAVAFWTPFSER